MERFVARPCTVKVPKLTPFGSEKSSGNCQMSMDHFFVWVINLKQNYIFIKFGHQKDPSLKKKDVSNSDTIIFRLI